MRLHQSEKMHIGCESRSICNFPVYFVMSCDIYMIFKNNNNTHKHIGKVIGIFNTSFSDTNYSWSWLSILIILFKNQNDFKMF